ncbi:hypothetical protein Ancab_036972 [Ancistrocladus abbreviatus]
MIARSEEEVELFDQMDEELDWTEEMMRNCQRTYSAALLHWNLVKWKGRGGDSQGGKKFLVYTKLDDDNGESSEASSDERNGYVVPDEEGEIREFEDEEDGASAANNEQLEEDGPLGDDGYECPRTSGSTRNSNMLEEAVSPGSSSDSRRVMQAVSSQKLTTLSALDARPSTVSKRPACADELEEGEIAFSGDSHMDHQQSGSWNHELKEGGDEQVVRPKIKRKHSIRLRPRQTAERQEDRYGFEKPSVRCGDSSQFPSLAEQRFEARLRTKLDPKMFGDSASLKQEQNEPSCKSRRNLPPRVGNAPKLHASPKSSHMNSFSVPAEEGDDISRGSFDGEVFIVGGSTNHCPKMTDAIQRKV